MEGVPLVYLVHSLLGQMNEGLLAEGQEALKLRDDESHELALVAELEHQRGMSWVWPYQQQVE